MPAQIPDSIAEWSTTAGSNQPSGSANVGPDLDDNLRAMQVAVRQTYTRGSIASAATCDIGTVDAELITVTGTTTITSLGSTLGATGYGVHKLLTFAGALTLTNSASLACITSANITTVAGDSCMVEYSASGWTMLWYARKTGQPVASQVQFGDGTVSLPGITFSADTDNGFYRIGANNWAVSVGGIKRVEFNNAGDVAFTPAAFSSIGSDAITLRTSIGTGTGITIKTDDLSANTSAVAFYTGASSLNTSGAVSIYSGAGYSAVGAVTITGGATTIGGSGGAQGAHVTITSGTASSSSSGFAGNLNLAVGDYGSGNTNGCISFKLYTDAGAQRTIAQFRSRENLLAWCTDTGTPSISSGAGTGATIAGTNYGFTVTLGTTPTTSIAINLAAWGGPSNPANSAVVVAGSTNTAYTVGASATTTAVTISTSATPTAGDKLHVILSWYAAAL